MKTNAIRLLDQKKIKYQMHDYSATSAISGMEVASALNEDPATVFKTLVTKGKSNYYVFLVPVNSELNLKKAAQAVNEKSVENIAKQILFLKISKAYFVSFIAYLHNTNLYYIHKSYFNYP